MHERMWDHSGNLSIVDNKKKTLNSIERNNFILFLMKSLQKNVVFSKKKPLKIAKIRVEIFFF